MNASDGDGKGWIVFGLDLRRRAYLSLEVPYEKNIFILMAFMVEMGYFDFNPLHYQDQSLQFK